MALEKSKSKSFLRWGIRLLLAGCVSFLIYRFVDGTIDQNSGPFAYFKDAPGEGTVLARGQREVAQWLKIGNDGAVAIENGRKSGFKCRSLQPAYDGKNIMMNTKTGGRHYVFGYFGENWYFTITTDENGIISRSFQDIAPPINL